MAPELVKDIVVAVYRFMTLGNLGLMLAFLVGVGFVPFLIYFRLLPGKKLRGTVMNVMWTIGALGLGGAGHVLDRRENGRYEVNQVVRDGEDWFVVRDGEKHELQGNPDAWSRLGWRPFSVTYEKSKAVFESLSPDIDLGEAVTDGGVVMTGVERAGYPEVVVPPEDDEYAVSMSRVDTQLSGSGGSELAFVAGEQALKNHGGDTSGLSNLALIAATLISTLSGAAMAYVMVAL